MELFSKKIYIAPVFCSPYFRRSGKRQNRKQSLVLIHMFFCLIFLLYRSSYVPDNSAIAMIRQQLAIFYISIFIIINQ